MLQFEFLQTTSDILKATVSDLSSKRIYTKYGDEGETNLLYGGRVSKSNPHTEANGMADEAVSAMGLARALCNDPWVKGIIEEKQRELFSIGGELATDPEYYGTFKTHFDPVTPEMVRNIELLIDNLQNRIEIPRVFVIPGGSSGSAAIDMARAAIRTTERRVVDLQLSGKLANPELLRYLNRLGDLLFILGRYEDRDLMPTPD